MGPFSLISPRSISPPWPVGPPQKNNGFCPPPGTRHPPRQSKTPHRENHRFLGMFVPDLGMFVTFMLRPLSQAYLSQSRPQSAQRKTPPSASTYGRHQPKTSNHEESTSNTFSQSRRARSRHRSRPCRSESLSAGSDCPDHTGWCGLDKNK